MNLVAVLSRLYVQVILVGLVCAFLMLRYSSTLPTVMQDEYVYLVQAVLEPIASNEYGNFLHSAVYSRVLVFGDNFYLSVKAINTVFLLAFGFATVVLSRKFLPLWSGGLLGVITALSATSLYSSVFMPEMMFYALAAWAIAFFVLGWETERPKAWWFLASLVAVVLAGLTKPHALILVLGIISFVFVMLAMRRITLTKATPLLAAFSAGYVVLKLCLGFLLAGPNGLSLIGPNYEQALRRFFDRFSWFGEGALSASAGAMNPVSTQGAASFGAFALGQTLLLTIGFSFMTMGLPLLLIKPFSRLTDYQLLTIAISVVYIVAIAGFTAFVSFTGDDHSNRLLGRYFEFLIPLVLIACFVEVERRVQVRGARKVAIFLATPTLAALWWLILAKADLKLADSAILLGSFRSEFLPWLVIASLAVVVFAFSQGPKHLLAITVTSTLLVVASIGLSVQQRQLELNSVKIGADFAGDTLRQSYADVPGGEVLIVGTNEQLAFVTKFWSVKKGVEHIILSPGTGLSIQDPALDSFSLVVELSGVVVVNGSLLAEGEGYRIFGK